MFSVDVIQGMTSRTRFSTDSSCEQTDILYSSNTWKDMPGPRPVWTPDEGAIAQESVENRWPKILSGILDDVELGIEA